MKGGRFNNLISKYTKYFRAEIHLPIQPSYSTYPQVYIIYIMGMCENVDKIASNDNNMITN